MKPSMRPNSARAKLRAGAVWSMASDKTAAFLLLRSDGGAMAGRSVRWVGFDTGIRRRRPRRAGG